MPYFNDRQFQEEPFNPYFYARTLLEGSRSCDIYPSKTDPLFAVFDELLNSKRFGATYKGSGTLRYDRGFWFICTYQLALPIPNVLAKAACKEIEKYEKAIKRKLARTKLSCVCGMWLCSVCMEQKDTYNW